MTIARRPSPFGELLSLRQAMDRLFEDSYVRPGNWGQGSVDALALPLDVSTTKDELIIEAALPGVRPDDVEVTVEDGTLTIRGEVNAERTGNEGDYLVREIRRGTFTRSLSLPSGLEPDKAQAEFKDGMLKLHVPRAEQVKPRQIRITPTVDGQSNGQSNGRGETKNISTPAGQKA